MELKAHCVLSKAGLTKTLRIMKLTAIILLSVCLAASASGLSQKVTLTAKNAPLETVIQQIKAQTGYSFFYNVDWLEKVKAVTVDIKNAEIEKALDIVFKNQPLSYKVINNTIVLELKQVAVKNEASLLLPPVEIKGRVVNENGEALVGANVMIKGTNKGATTDNNGYYKIENVAEGPYTLEISFIGYATKITTLKVTGDNTASFNFTLSLSLVNLDEVTTTSTLSARKIRANPTTIAIIKQEDLKNRNLNNIGSVLDAVPGIIIPSGFEGQNSANTSNNIRSPYILIRGINVGGVSIKYLIDGTEVVSGFPGFLQTMDPNDIQSIEILKGPMASTLYGNGAAAGIISITTKRGKVGKTKANFKAMFTQYANDYANYNGYSQDYSANISGGNEQFNYLLGAGYNLYPTPKLNDTSSGINDKTWSYKARINGKLKNLDVDLSLQYGNEKNGSGSQSATDNKFRESLGLSTYPLYPFSDIRTFQRNFLTSLHLKHTIAKNWYHDLNIGYNITNGNTYSNTLSDDTYFIIEQLFSKINARYFMFYDKSWSKNVNSAITAGFEYVGYETKQMQLNATSPLQDFFSASTPAVSNAGKFTRSPYSSTGYFAEVVTGFKNNLFLTTGIRFDVNSAYGESVGAYPQPRIGLSYVIEPGQFKIKPRIVWGVASSPPDPTYKVSSTTISPYYTLVNIGNPDIKPQRSVGYEYGADIFYGNNYSLNITYYDQRIKDMILSSSEVDYTTNPITYTGYWFNIAEVMNKGLEVSAKAILDAFTLDFSYTQTVNKWGKETGQATSPTLYPGAPLSDVPSKSFFARLSYNIPSIFSWTKKGGRASLDWKYNGSAFSFDGVSYALATDAWNNAPDPKPAYPDYYSYYVWQKGYSYFNLRMDYSVTNYATLYIDVQNLLDRQGSANGQLLSGRFPGRRINFGFNVNF